MTLKILVVEDVNIHRTLLKEVLTYHGYKVLEAENGEGGVLMAREHKPDLILMDVQMPIMDGMEALRMLKADAETSHIKVISLASFSVSLGHGELRSAGFDDVISKPIDILRLPDIIKKHTGGM